MEQKASTAQRNKAKAPKTTPMQANAEVAADMRLEEERSRIRGEVREEVEAEMRLMQLEFQKVTRRIRAATRGTWDEETERT